MLKKETEESVNLKGKSHDKSDSTVELLLIMPLEELFSQLGFVFGIRIRIHKVSEYGSNLDPDA